MFSSSPASRQGCQQMHGKREFSRPQQKVRVRGFAATPPGWRTVHLQTRRCRFAQPPSNGCNPSGINYRKLSASSSVLSRNDAWNWFYGSIGGSTGPPHLWINQRLHRTSASTDQPATPPDLGIYGSTSGSTGPRHLRINQRLHRTSASTDQLAAPPDLDRVLHRGLALAPDFVPDLNPDPDLRPAPGHCPVPASPSPADAFL
ncbi:MAG: hypothetical protein JWL81_1393 [Verrucomicrobiales bacterium]|nr:hypothetical protein [Verrucomicrobiales bacterium]